MIHVYTGDGKGKTTASLGLAVRAVGAGKRRDEADKFRAGRRVGGTRRQIQRLGGKPASRNGGKKNNRQATKPDKM